jgi:hypothetical protein
MDAAGLRFSERQDDFVNRRADVSRKQSHKLRLFPVLREDDAALASAAEPTGL